MFKLTLQKQVAAAPSMARGYATNVTRTMFPRHYRLRHKIQNEQDATPLKDGSLFIRRPTAGPTTSILSSAHPSPASVSSRTGTSTSLSHPDLPPALRTSATGTTGKKAAVDRPEFAKLSEEQIAEMKALRLENPAKYTRSYLAKKYNVSDMFVKCYIPASKEVQVARIKAQQRSFDKKGWKAQEIVVQRQKRREIW
ncbi:MAG: mitochondrial ribosomal protein subunit L20-domain-containing protein [Linnemannia gamsii]|nr:hypothetical protein BGX24_007961 [Mortierella sp. AD032]KAK3843423.1 MAG: mitochondrial ribosomal protein subunit L20-domain-containing protein [Linnemannia gamsii]